MGLESDTDTKDDGAHGALSCSRQFSNTLHASSPAPLLRGGHWTRPHGERRKQRSAAGLLGTRGDSNAGSSTRSPQSQWHTPCFVGQVGWSPLCLFQLCCLSQSRSPPPAPSLSVPIYEREPSLRSARGGEERSQAPPQKGFLREYHILETSALRPLPSDLNTLDASREDPSAHGPSPISRRTWQGGVNHLSSPQACPKWENLGGRRGVWGQGGPLPPLTTCCPSLKPHQKGAHSPHSCAPPCPQ